MTSTTASAVGLAPVWMRDLIAGLAVSLVALPLCLGIAQASGAPLLSGVWAGVIGGVVVGWLSKSPTSVSGPAVSTAAVVAAQIPLLQSYHTFLLAVVIAGFMQMGLGLLRSGFLSDFFPGSVIKGLIAAIGIILILKQIPHLLGHDADPEGDFAFLQVDHSNTFYELGEMFWDIHPGAAVVGLGSIGLLWLWDTQPGLKSMLIPGQLVVIVLGVGVSRLFQRLGDDWTIIANNFVQLPLVPQLADYAKFLAWPDFSQWTNLAVYGSAATIAAVASLETLLNLEAADRLDPRQRISPASRELFAQGAGNVLAGLVGGIPITSMIVRSSVNVQAGALSRWSTIFHGLWLLVGVLFFSFWLNMIPLACLAAILFYTGIKLCSPRLVGQMWQAGFYQFVPFVVTVAAIVFTDLLIGVLIGLAVSLGFILNSNLRRPIRRIVEKHLGGEVLHLELANQVSFLNRAVIIKNLEAVPRGGQVLIDASNTDYIDPDILDLLRDFTEKSAPARNIKVSLQGFQERYFLQDRLQYVDYSTRELQNQLTPAQVLQILLEGNQRFLSGQRLTRDLRRQIGATSAGQHPLAVVLGCIDSRTSTELIFDLGLGDIFSVRIAGNILSNEVLGSLEYACAVAGAKLILVMGHTRCGAVTSAVELAHAGKTAAQATHCDHLESIVSVIQESVSKRLDKRFEHLSKPEKDAYVDEVIRGNVAHVVTLIQSQSKMLGGLLAAGKIGIVGAVYDVATGRISILSPTAQTATESVPNHYLLRNV
ncbi:MAG: SulP family inorganic anion transporter [Pirellulales bacterium]|nr:SulP family inorganic anion transporter [Pirellulales bacterium]